MAGREIRIPECGVEVQSRTETEHPLSGSRMNYCVSCSTCGYESDFSAYLPETGVETGVINPQLESIKVVHHIRESGGDQCISVQVAKEHHIVGDDFDMPGQTAGYYERIPDQLSRLAIYEAARASLLSLAQKDSPHE